MRGAEQVLALLFGHLATPRQVAAQRYAAPQPFARYSVDLADAVELPARMVLIPIRMGAGLRLGVNAGYMKFSKKHRWLPF